MYKKILKLNKSTNDSFIFVEGFATAMSLLQIVNRFETDITVIVCFNCDNLKAVISHLYPYNYNYEYVSVYL